MQHLYTDLCNMQHLLVHPITIPLNFEVFVQVDQQELLQGAEGLSWFPTP